MNEKIININDIKIANKLPFVLIAGPCQIESLEHSLFMAENIKKIATKLSIPFIYKSSFDKANRSSVHNKRGVGLDKSIDIFRKVKENFGCPVITDVHDNTQCEAIAEVVDIIQIPAFLCRQTDLLEAAAKTKKIINVKKGQFLAPWDMKNVVEKLHHFGANDIMLTERGACFGYNNLVSDMRSLIVMSELNVPVVFDATHSVQEPGGLKSSSGGNRKYVEYLARAAISVGVASLFMEVHDDPDNAPSDGPCMIKLSELENLLIKLKKYDEITKSY